MVNNSCALYSSLNGLNRVIDLTSDIEEYERWFADIPRITISTKLRDFQYRLLHKKLPSNKGLYVWKIKSSDTCDFCTKPDSILHMLFECNCLTRYWNKVKEYVTKYAAKSELEFTTKTLITNRVHAKAAHVVNVLILIAKQLVYRYKCKKIKVDYTLFIHEVKMYEHIERYQAAKANKVVQHQIKWQEIW